MPDKPLSPEQIRESDKGSNDGSSELAKVTAQRDEALARATKSDDSYQELRLQDSKKAWELGELRKKAEQRAARQGGGNDLIFPEDGGGRSEPSTAEQLQAIVRPLQDNQDLIRWRQENPGWEKNWPEVQTFLKNPENAALVASARPDGSIDYHTSLSRTMDKIKIRRFERAEAEATEAKAKIAAEKEKANQHGFISGSSAAGDQSGGGITIEQFADMSSDEMLKSGALPVNRKRPATPLYPDKK